MLTIVAAMEQEVSSLRRSLAAGSVALFVTGAGRARALQGARHALGTTRPTALLHVGFGGALTPDLKCGDVVVCDQLHVAETRTSAAHSLLSHPVLVSTALGLENLRGLKVCSGASVTTPRIAATPADKEALARLHRAQVADLESYWIGLEALHSGVPFLSVRVVLDEAQQRLPPFVQRYVETQGLARLLLVAADLLLQPWALKEALRLRAQSNRAAESVALFTTTLVSAIHQNSPSGAVSGVSQQRT